MTAPHELVYVVPRSLILGPGDGWRGVRTAEVASLLETLRTAGELLPRPEMEVDPSYKQVIPYLVLRDRAAYFLMRRTRGGADARLHERYSIGIGGHLNGVDLDAARAGDLFEAGLRREWHEEIEASFEPSFRFVGLLNDDETEVGRVHLGVVFAAETGGRAVGVREVEKLSGGMASPAEVAAVADRLETWSALVFDHLESEGER